MHTTDKKQNIWRYPAYLKNNQTFIKYMKEAWEDYTTNNADHIHNSTLFWEAGKAYLRGKIISYSTAYKKAIHTNFLKSSDTMRQAQITYQMNPTDDTKKDWLDAKRDFNMRADDKEMLYKDHRDLTMHKFGNKAEKLLSYLTKENFHSIMIKRLKTPDGTDATGPTAINTLLIQFHEKLQCILNNRTTKKQRRCFSTK